MNKRSAQDERDRGDRFKSELGALQTAARRVLDHCVAWGDEGRIPAADLRALHAALAETQRSCHSSETDETKPAIG